MAQKRVRSEIPGLVDVSGWNTVVRDVSLALGMRHPPSVEIDTRTALGGGMAYDATRDVLHIHGGWTAVEPNPLSPASRGLVAHELGHRLDRGALTSNRRTLIAVTALTYVVLICAVVAGTVSALSTVQSWREPPVMPVWFVLLPIVALVPVIATARAKWPCESRADEIAARLFGPQCVHAYLEVFASNGAWTRISPTHPSHTMRRGRLQRIV